MSEQIVLTCPACRRRLWTHIDFLGNLVTCSFCNKEFIASSKLKLEPTAPAHAPEDQLSTDGQPLCPGCRRRINWDWMVCFHCGEQLEFREGARQRKRKLFRQPRRDTVPHRGGLIANMGAITLISGVLSLFTFGLGALVAVPLGIVTIVLASGDLNLIRAGQMDDDGREQIENGRQLALIGLVLSVVFAGGWILLFLCLA
jgi:hypothetical protein